MNEFLKSISNEPEEAREELLRSHAMSVEEMVYSKTLSDEELAKLKNDYIQDNIKFAGFKKQLDEIKEDYKNKMRPLDMLAKERIAQLSTKKVDEEGEVFLIDDQETKTMYTVTKAGEVLSSRPLMQSERQMSINPVAINE